MKSILLVIVTLFTANLAFSEDPSVIGKWVSVDDETGQRQSIVELYQKDGELRGKLLELLIPEDKGSVCSKCKGDLKNHPIEGMEIIWGLTLKDGVWQGGQILDPSRGRAYRAKISLQDNPDLLDVRGFMGIAALGRTQTWQRVE